MLAKSLQLRSLIGLRYLSAAPVIDVEGYVRKHLVSYTGDKSFLAGPTPRTKKLWAKCSELLKAEGKKGGVLAIDPDVPSDLLSHKPGYIAKDLELIVGLQTDEPLKRAMKPQGGWSLVKQAVEAYGYKPNPEVGKIFTRYRKSHNDGVFDVYTEEMRIARSAGILTGLPDNYGRGRIISDYRRVPLYGVDALIEAKKADKKALGEVMTEEVLRSAEEIQEQIRSLQELKEMAKMHGYDISKPAKNAREAIQWLYFGYLGTVKLQDGAAMSIGRLDGFLDTYIEKDIKEGKLTETEAQELIDDFVIKLRFVRHLRPPSYNEIFAGDPTWVTVVLGGMYEDNQRTQVCKTSFRFLNTLHNLGPAPEPNLTILWAKNMPNNWKRYCAEVSQATSSIQYENDDLMRPRFGCDYGIACCVSAMTLGKQMQLFGARCNLPKLLLYVMNEGRDEVSGDQVGPKYSKVKDGPLEYEDVVKRFEEGMEWLAGLYVNTMNCIHYMHDKYNYEKLQLALHDSEVHRWLAFGVSGLSVIADSLSAIRYAKVTPVRDATGLAKSFKIEGDFPKYGNDDDRVDAMAKWTIETFMDKLRKHKSYRNSVHTLSALTITSNVMYGKHTGDTPDGRKLGDAFAPGANPMHGRDESGALASLSSVAKMPYDSCRDGISNTFTVLPESLGRSEAERTTNLVNMLDGYFEKDGHHINVNVLKREVLRDAMEHPEKYPQLTIRVSGYAVNFIKLSRQQQLEVIARTFHESM
jgi:formate C-acetyltransferase